MSQTLVLFSKKYILSRKYFTAGSKKVGFLFPRGEESGSITGLYTQEPWILTTRVQNTTKNTVLRVLRNFSIKFLMILKS